MDPSDQGARTSGSQAELDESQSLLSETGLHEEGSDISSDHSGFSTSRPDHSNLSSGAQATAHHSESNADATTMSAHVGTFAQPGSAMLDMPLEEGEAEFKGGYDPEKYKNLSVDPQLSDLFGYIGRYKLEKRQLPCGLKPFIPDYIAAMGDVDEFLKPPRPDGAFEPLGLKVLDEPSVHQSDPAVMRKFLRAHMKGTAAVEDEAETLDEAIRHGDNERDAKIEQWIGDVQKLRGSEVAGEFKPSGRFPSIDALMHDWPEEMEPLVRSLRAPEGNVDVDLHTLACTLCGLLDIPVYQDPVDSLHMLFTLFLELRSNEAVDDSRHGALNGVGQFNVATFA